jgi:hypothetical protein
VEKGVKIHFRKWPRESGAISLSQVQRATGLPRGPMALVIHIVVVLLAQFPIEKPASNPRLT